MNRNDVTELIIEAKVRNGLKWEDVAKRVGLSKVMSAIDFRMDLQREPHPAGDRVQIVMSEKFLSYKTY